MADRIGVISKGELIVVEDKDTLMRRLGKRQLILTLAKPLASIPTALGNRQLELDKDHLVLTYTFDVQADDNGIAALLKQLGDLGIDFKDLRSKESSLEDIFVGLVHGGGAS